MIAILEALRAGLFHKHNIQRNLVAGFVVAILTFPLSMAFAVASGSKPEAGLYTSIVAVTVVSLFGGSIVQISGPTSAFVGILLGISSKYGPEGLQIATVMAGLIMLFMGLFKCGRMIKFIPEQVIVGFTSGIAVNMFTGQLPNFFGLKCGVLPVNFHDKVAVLIRAFHTISWPSAGFAIVTLLVVEVCKRTFFRKIPGPLIALIFGITMQVIFEFEGVATIGSVFGGLSNKLPTFTPTAKLSFHTIQKLMPPAFAIAVLGSIESLLCAVISDGMIGAKHSSNQELVGHGLANILSPMFGGIASTGSLTRTISSIRSGGNSPLSGIVSAIALCIMIRCLAPFARFIPLCVLASILVVVAVNTMNLRHFCDLLLNAPKSDSFVLILTFCLTLFCGIVMAVNIGVLLSALMLMHRMADSSHIDRIKKGKHADYDFSQLPEGIAIYSIAGPVFFGMIDRFSGVFDSTESGDRVVILRMFDVPFVDATGLENLHSAVLSFKKRGITVMFSEANDFVLKKMKRARVADHSIMHLADKSIIEVIEAANKILHI